MGAPQAQPAIRPVGLADRFQLLTQNMRDMLRRASDRHFPDLKPACRRAEDENTAAAATKQKEAPLGPRAGPVPTSAMLRREAFFHEVKQLVEKGYSLRAIARKLDVSRVAVKRYARADHATFCQAGPSCLSDGAGRVNRRDRSTS